MERLSSGDAVPGVADPPDSSPCCVGSSSSGMWSESLGRWPLTEFDVEPGVVVVMGGGDKDRGTVPDMT